MEAIDKIEMYLRGLTTKSQGEHEYLNELILSTYAIRARIATLEAPPSEGELYYCAIASYNAAINAIGVGAVVYRAQAKAAIEKFMEGRR